jgi:hypothetical protein
MDAGANISSQQADGATALILAAEAGHSELVDLLLLRKADPNVKRKDGVTALMLAAKSQHAEVAVSLLRANANTFVSGVDTIRQGLKIEKDFFLRLVPAIDMNDVPAWGLAAIAIRSTWRSLLLVARVVEVTEETRKKTFSVLNLCEETARSGVIPDGAEALTNETRALVEQINKQQIQGSRGQSATTMLQVIGITATLMNVGSLAWAILTPDSAMNQTRDWGVALRSGDADIRQTAPYFEAFAIDCFCSTSKEGIHGALLHLGSLWRDMCLLKKIAVERKLGRQSPFDPLWLGSLWPDGSAEWLPDHP